eukprot:12426651-Karenia_brevis.AAC.1
MQGTFAATPPLESLRYLLLWSMTKGAGDVSRDHFHPPAVSEMYMSLPADGATPGILGRPFRELHGTRDAANQWDNYFNEKNEK